MTVKAGRKLFLVDEIVDGSVGDGLFEGLIVNLAVLGDEFASFIDGGLFGDINWSEHGGRDRGGMID